MEYQKYRRNLEKIFLKGGSLSDSILRFQVEDAELIEEDASSRFAWARIQAFSSGPNRHDLICDEETLERTAKTIYNTPIMYSVS